MHLFTMLSLLCAFPPDAAATDLRDLQGTWKIARWQEKALDDLPAEIRKDLTDLRILIKGDKMAWSGKNPLEQTFKLDAAKSPRRIDLTWKERNLTFAQVGELLERDGKKPPPEPKERTVRIAGIYKLSGDRFTMCLHDKESSGEAPREFVVSVDPPTFLIVLERVPAKKN